MDDGGRIGQAHLAHGGGPLRRLQLQQVVQGRAYALVVLPHRLLLADDHCRLVLLNPGASARGIGAALLNCCSLLLSLGHKCLQRCQLVAQG